MSSVLFWLLVNLPGAFFAPVIHEFTKARVSAALGDPQPRKNGFITFDPLRFFEPIGFILMLAYGVGWGQPVPTSPFYYKDKRKGIALTYITPIIANLFVGMAVIFLASVLRRIPLEIMQWGDGFLIYALTRFGRLNIRLAVFNLLPIHPLAMSKLLPLFVSPETTMTLNQHEKPMQLLMLFLLMFGVLDGIIEPITHIFMSAVLW
ncbi:MAG: site-2 protease family protein [Defluviitaleaceae bacterium]|nr:site-2 protease family protein [Defluviitaleaceae bacterium]